MGCRPEVEAEPHRLRVSAEKMPASMHSWTVSKQLAEAAVGEDVVDVPRLARDHERQPVVLWFIQGKADVRPPLGHQPFERAAA